jgi:flavin-dependent dehydrogenase
MNRHADALVVGAGPAGAASALHLARAGWQVILVEQSAYPRQKVCGECLTAGALSRLDDLGVGAAIRERAGPELHQVGWSHHTATLAAAMPPCLTGPHRYGRALGRDHLDALLSDQAVAAGVVRIQPAKVRAIRGVPGDFVCEIEPFAGETLLRRVPVVIDAHGSWETGPWDRGLAVRRPPRIASDLFGFKASFRGARLAPGLLPVLAFPGGYGGMVLADGGRMTLAGCIRRDTLARWRSRSTQTSAGAAFEAYLRQSCRQVAAVLEGAERLGPWMSVGPLRPGLRLGGWDGPFRVGNAAAEIHPLIGEGINMALQSAALLAQHLTGQSPRSFNGDQTRRVHRELAALGRETLGRRLRFAALSAHVAMRTPLAASITTLLKYHPPLLTWAAQWAGKAQRPFDLPPALEVRHEYS